MDDVTVGNEATKKFDAEAFAMNLARAMENGGKALAAYLKPRESGEVKDNPPTEMAEVIKTLTSVAEYWLSDHERSSDIQTRIAKGYLDLWGSAARRLAGQEAMPAIAPSPRDRRFADPEWKSNQFFDFMMQLYLLTTQWAHDLVRNAEGLDPHTRKKAEFYVQQITNALAPSNFVLTNPEVLRETLASSGTNLARGMQMLAEDIEAGKGMLKIRQSDPANLELGVNIATTPGKVIFQNDLIQLIQYEPTTEKVLRTPLLIVPPWINKFYILDLRARNSFVRWAVSQGHTVFVISWVNPDERLAQKSFDDYMSEGYLAALDAIEKATGEREVNAIGYCLGGTLLASTLAWMAARKDDRIKSATFFVTMMDFREAGELGVFIDEEQLKSLEDKMNKRGFLEGSDMATTFNMLRANDLIWSFVVNNYLLGNEPFPFDLLYWNSDSTRMPANMHSFYLRKMYQENLLAQPGGITLAGVPIDLGKVKTPAYFISTREDHIAPWKSTYRGTQLLGGPKRFVLAASGHIAGIVNPPDSGKYNHWINDELPSEPEAWFRGATEIAGSWWPDWQRWVTSLDKRQVPARQPGDGRLNTIEDAPGRYVAVQAS
jgi:polyhydroxyalkanoate synthase